MYKPWPLPAPVAQWHKSLTAVRLACVVAWLRRSGFNSRLWRLVSTCKSMPVSSFPFWHGLHIGPSQVASAFFVANLDHGAPNGIIWYHGRWRPVTKTAHIKTILHSVTQNRPLWRMMSTYCATQSWVACQKRRRRTLWRILTCLYRTLIFNLVNELLIHQPLVYGTFSLLTDIKRVATLLTFKNELKTFLFSKHICWLYCVYLYRIKWLSIVQQNLKQHHLTLPEAADLAQNRPLWRMMSTYGATQLRVACQKRRRRLV